MTFRTLLFLFSATFSIFTGIPSAFSQFQTQNPGTGNAPAPALRNTSMHRFEFGAASQGPETHPFEQLTGEDVYQNAESAFYFTWFGYNYVVPADLFIIKGFSGGIEYHNYTLKPILKEGSLKNKPRPTLNNNIYLGKLRLYFLPIYPETNDTLESQIFQVYFGIGWGYMDGKITGEYFRFLPSKTFSTEISGAYTYRELGAELRGDTWALGLSVRFVRANQIRVKDDFFGQKEPGQDDLYLNFDGLSNTFQITYMF